MRVLSFSSIPTWSTRSSATWPTRTPFERSDLFAKRQIPGSTGVLVTNDGGLYIYDYATDSST